MSGSTGCNMSQQSSITSGDIPSEAPKKFVIGGAGRWAELMGYYFEGLVAVGGCRI